MQAANSASFNPPVQAHSKLQFNATRSLLHQPIIYEIKTTENLTEPNYAH